MKTPFSSCRNPHLYEIPILIWLNDIAQRFSRPVTLGTIPENVWDELAAYQRGPEQSRGARGWDFVWLMGVWERSSASAVQMLADPAARKSFDEGLPGWQPEQVAGSPYAVHRYEPDSRVGTWADLDRARAALNKRGIGLMLDFVGNHVALDHSWMREHPEYFIQGGEADLQRDPAGYFAVETAAGPRAILARGRDPYFPPWPDAAQLDYFSEDLRAAQLAQLVKIAAHCDGLRCDMAMLCLNDVFARTWASHLAGRQPPAQEFWTQVMRAVPGIVWLAEVYWGLESRLLDLGFQFAYDKPLYDLLRAANAASSTNDPGRASDIAARLRAPEEARGRMAHFLENHDEARAASVFGEPSFRSADSGDSSAPNVEITSTVAAESNSVKHLAAAAVLVATLPGMRFFHYGQLQGRHIHLPIGLTAQMPDTPQTCNAAIRAFYRKLLTVTAASAFQSGAFQRLDVTTTGDASFASLSAYQWAKPLECGGLPPRSAEELPRSAEAPPRNAEESPRFVEAPPPAADERMTADWWVIVANPGGVTAQGRVHFPDGVAPSAGPQIDAGKRYVFADELNGPSYLRDGAEIVTEGLYVRLDAFQAHVFHVIVGA